MSEYVKLTTAGELPPEGEAKEFELDGKMICVAHSGDGLSAMDNVCLHRGGPLGQGVLDGNKIVCPWHGWTFDVNTGACMHDTNARIRVYPLKVEGKEVWISME